MLLYRVFPYLEGAPAGENGHPGFLWSAQGTGRWDNPAHYLAWYLASHAAGAIAEVFGDLRIWNDAMFELPALPGARRALGTYGVPDDTPLLDFDDANALAARALRPTQIVSPNRAATQQIALDAFNEVGADGSRTWAGLTWWSSRRASWPVHCLWGTTPTCEDVTRLDVAHPAVQDAATALSKPLA